MTLTLGVYSNSITKRNHLHNNVQSSYILYNFRQKISCSFKKKKTKNFSLPKALIFKTNHFLRLSNGRALKTSHFYETVFMRIRLGLYLLHMHIISAVLSKF